MDTLALALFGLAVLPLILAVWNLALYRRPPRVGRVGTRGPAVGAGVSVIVPARNERGSIREAVESVLANRDVDLEVVVVDDASDDGTADIVRALARRDPRVRLEPAPGLPAGWNGKQHACAHGARVSTRDWLVFVDADVRLAPDALVRAVAFAAGAGADLVSGVPRQVTGTLAERLVVPLIHFVLLGYLPMIGMRLSGSAAFAAGCGQLFVARRAAYEDVGGHGNPAVRGSRHDGVTLPRAFRRAGRSTDLFDATDVATCRMYRSAGEVWNGFVKNADEGMASPAAIVPWTVLLAGGHVLPFLLLPVAVATGAGATAVAALAAAVAAGWLVRFLLAARFRQSAIGGLLHPAGVAVLLAIQFAALARGRAGRQVAWKGRTQS